MEARFDIFKYDAQGDVRWIEAAQDLAAAKTRVSVLGESWPGLYLILDQKTGDKISIQVGSSGVQTPRRVA